MMRAIFGLAIVLLAAPTAFRADDEDRKQREEYRKQQAKDVAAARVMIQKLLEMCGQDQAREAPKLAKCFELGSVHHAAFKPRSKGGLGIGDKPGAIEPDSIELKIVALAKKAPDPERLAREAPDLIRAAEVTRAVAELTPYWARETSGARDREDWMRFSAEMKKGSEELIKAIKSGDPKAVHKAATNLNSACVNCHGVCDGRD
jgi:hypothetical protein